MSTSGNIWMATRQLNRSGYRVMIIIYESLTLNTQYSTLVVAGICLVYKSWVDPEEKLGRKW